MRLTINNIQELKNQNAPIPMITAYDYTTARIVEASDIPIILVGDYQEAIVLLEIFFLSLFVEPIAIIFLQHIVYNSLVRDYTISLNMTLLLQVLLYLILTPAYGIQGLVYANVCIIFIRSGINFVLIKRFETFSRS